MATGTVKDPFEDYKRPICGEFVEIGQPTFAELIWAREVLTRATSGPDPDVATALRIIAYSKGPVELPEMRKKKSFHAIPPPVASEAAAAKYAVNARNNAKAYKQKVKGLGIAKTSVEFRKLVANDPEILSGDPELLNPLGLEDCVMLSGGGFGGITPIITPTGCPPSECVVDAVFSIDNSGSMGQSITNVKNGANQMASLISTVANGSYRFALTRFGQGQNNGNLDVLLDMTNRNCGNITEFQTAVNTMNASGSTEPWHQQLLQVQGNAGLRWTFREESNARIIFTITDESGNVTTADTLAAASKLGSCNIRWVLIWTGLINPYNQTFPNRTADGFSNEGQFFDAIAKRTGGTWVWAPRGTDIVPLMTSFIFSVCASAGELAECPGGVDKILNGRFETSIANWNNLSTLPRTISWNSGFQSLELNGAAGQKVTGLTPGDIAIMSFDVWVETTPSAAKADAPLVPLSGPACPAGYSLLDEDDWTGGNTSLQGWDGSGAIVETGAMKFATINEGGGTGSLTDKLILTASDKIKTSNPDGTGLTDLLTGSGNARDLDVDTVQKHIYWMEINQAGGTENAIYRANFDGSGITKIKDVVYSLGLFVESTTPSYIYYGEASGSFRIRRMDLDGTNEITIATSPRRVVRLQVDKDNGYIYWVGSSSASNGSVYRCNLDGSNLIVIIDETSQPKMANARGIAVDKANGKIYVATATDLLWMNLDGSGFADIGDTGGAGDDVWIDPVAGRLYVADGGTDTVFKYRLDGSNRQQLFPTSTANFSGVTRLAANAGYVTKTSTGLTPGDDFRFAVDFQAIGGSGTVAIQLFDGAVLLAEKTGITIAAIENISATVPASGQITAVIRAIPNPTFSMSIRVSSTSFCVSGAVGGSGGLLKYKLRNNSGIVLTEDSVTDSDLQPPGVANAQRFDLFTTIGIDGTIEVFFTAEDGDDVDFYIDNCLLCILKEDDCGPGTRNLVLNPNFESGVEFWDDSTNTPISPTDDPNVWDDLLNAIIVSITGEREVRTTINDLKPGANYSVNFELTSFEPEVIGTLEFIYGVLDSSDVVIIQATKLRSEVNPPERLQIDFVAPANGIARIFFKGGITSGVAKIRNVLCCERSGECEPGYTKLSFNDFSTGRGAWAGGTYDAVNQLMTLGATGGGNDILSQTFAALDPGSTIQISLNVLNSPGGVGVFQVEFHSDGIIDQFNTGGTPGIKSFSSIVQDSGLVLIRIKNLSAFAANLDDILVCVQNAPPCDGSITNLEVLVEWDGIPRKPTNLFNAIVRYTIRDPNDPFSISTVTHIPTDEGALGLASCDLWKQQGQGGAPQNGILAFGMTPSLAATIDNGDFASVATRTNWVWSIPDTGGIQDTLSIAFPDPPEGLIESVEVFLLMNHVTPSGSDSSPVHPAPLLCTPDLASELTVSIRYINSQNLQREFTKKINKNDVWQQNADFTVGLPWDTDTPLGNGLKGSSARWESWEFVLDDVDGKGLDQCTTALFFTATGQGVLTFPEFGFKNSKARFVDACLAEILITGLSAGSAVNEVQSIVLPNPSGGTWTLTFDFGTVETTATIPWNASATMVRNKLAALPNIGSNNNVSVTGTGTQADPFLVTFKGTLGATDHKLLVANGSGLTGASTAFVTTITDGTINERQTITRNSSTVTADLLITFGGQTTVPLAYNRSLNEAQSALEGLSSIGAGNVTVSGDVTDRDAPYTGPLRVDFINALGGQNVSLMTVSPASLYTVTQDWMGGVPPAGGVNEKQEVTVEAFGGTFVLRVFDIGGTAPDIIVNTVQDGGNTNVDIYDIEFGGTLAGQDITACRGLFFSPSGAWNAEVSTVRNGAAGTDPITEIQRYSLIWSSGFTTGSWDIRNISGECNIDPIFSSIQGLLLTDLTKGVNQSSIIKGDLETASAITVGDLTVTNVQLAGSLNEIQTITITGNPTSGTFTLTIAGETTAPIPYNATATQVQNALNSLMALAGVTVTKSGSLPGDVIYTVTFGGASGGQDWEELVPDTTNLVGGSNYADTAGIAYNAAAAAVKSAIVTAASWLSDTDINVTSIPDLPEGMFQWIVEWTGAYKRMDIPRMQADPSGSQLTGAPIIIEEEVKGSGSNERQRLQILRATGGSFRITITIGGKSDTTTPIPWNTTAAGLEAQLLQLMFFDTPGQLSVVDEYPSSLPPSPINSSYIVVFQKIFGDVPPMVADFQETLLCNPIILPIVDPGPYPYPLPECDDLSDISCQSGPLLCKPGEGDEPIPEIDCCDNETITSSANFSRRIQIERDLFDPNRKVNGKRLTLRDLALIKGLKISEYTPYVRNWNLGTLKETSWTTEIYTKQSFVLIENNLDTTRGRQRILGHLAGHREILPARFVWPEGNFT